MIIYIYISKKKCLQILSIRRRKVCRGLILLRLILLDFLRLDRARTHREWGDSVNLQIPFYPGRFNPIHRRPTLRWLPVVALRTGCAAPHTCGHTSHSGHFLPPVHFKMNYYRYVSVRQRLPEKLAILRYRALRRGISDGKSTKESSRPCRSSAALESSNL